MFSSERNDRIDFLKSLDLPELLGLERESPRDVDLLVRIGGHYLKLRKPKECHEYYARALAIDPNDGWTHLYMGNLFCLVLSCHDEAVVHFKRAIDLLPGIACPHWCLADLYAAQGYLSRTEFQYRRAVEIDPEDSTAKQKLKNWLANKRVE